MLEVNVRMCEFADVRIDVQMCRCANGFSGGGLFGWESLLGGEAICRTGLLGRAVCIVSI